MGKGVPGRILGVTCVAIAILAWVVEVRSPFSLIAFFSSIAAGNNSGMTAAEVQAEIGQPIAVSTDPVTYETLNFPRSLVHVVRIAPDAPVTIRPVVVLDGLETVEVLAQQHGAIAAINGGFFDPNNQQTTSYVTIAGALALDPEQNQGLMNNPNVTTYLPRILNRAEFRRYHCATADGLATRYAVAVHHQLVPAGCELMDALGAGPALLPEFGGEAEAFIDVATNRDAVGAARPNARSGLGLTADGTIVLVMAAQRPPVGGHSVPSTSVPSTSVPSTSVPSTSRQPTGVSLPELAQIMVDLGVEQGMNLDGGSSSSLYYNGTTHYGRLDADGNEIRRSVKSILVVTPLPATDE